VAPTRIIIAAVCAAAGFALAAVGGCAVGRHRDADAAPDAGPFVVVLGVAQDAGAPQAGADAHPGWEDPSKRLRAACLGLVDPRSGRYWLFEATPDFRSQLHDLHRAAAEASAPGVEPALAGIFITHAHIGHYTGLMFLGHESMGASGVPVYAAARMARFLRTNGPWDQLVRYGNIRLQEIAPGREIALAPSLLVGAVPVPHRQEYSEVVAFILEGPSRRVLFLPDVDSWDDMDAAGTPIESLLAGVDVAYLDGTFFGDGEVPGRDMTGFPHPRIRDSVRRLGRLPASDRPSIRFIHLNHTNPAQFPGSAARREVEAAGFRVARRGERVELAPAGDTGAGPG